MRTYYLLSIGGVLAHLPSLVSAQTPAGGNCTAFDWDQQPGYIVNGTTQRVSGASTCGSKQNNTQSCPITATGDLGLSWSYRSNTSFKDNSWNTNNGPQSFLHNLVLNAVNSSLNGASWPYSQTGTIDTVEALPAGTSGYINFTSYIRCFEGIMTGCFGGNLTGRFPIQACAPVSHLVRDTTTFPIFDGFYSVVEIPQEDVVNYQDPYARQSRGESSSSHLKASLATVAWGLLMCVMVAIVQSL